MVHAWLHGLLTQEFEHWVVTGVFMDDLGKAWVAVVH